MAIYLMTTNIKGVSSMKLRRDIGGTQKTAWYMARRIREGWRRTSRHSAGRGGGRDLRQAARNQTSASPRNSKPDAAAAGKTAAAGVKDRPTNRIDAKVANAVDAATLTGYVHSKTDPDALVYTDESIVYWKLRRAHESVLHSVDQYVRGMAHTNGLDSFWGDAQAAATTASITA